MNALKSWFQNYFSSFSRGFRKCVFASLAIFLLGASAHADVHAECLEGFSEPAAQESLVRYFPASESLSQKVRDNARHFWDFGRRNGASAFPDLISVEGWVFGDAHPGNFMRAPYNGEMKFFFADIKDAGVAPFILDLSRLILSTHASIRDYSVSQTEVAEKLMRAYLEGMRGDTREIPGTLSWAFGMNPLDFADHQAEYLKKFARKSGFKFKKDVLEPLSSVLDRESESVVRTELKQLMNESYPNAKVVDFAFRPRDRGGSQEMTRYWVLAVVNGKKVIVEFKEASVAASEFYRAQPETNVRLQTAMDAFWDDADPAYRVVKIAGRDFLMRPKKFELVSMPYRQDSKADLRYLFDLAEASAFEMGVRHAQQSRSPRYISLLNLSEGMIVLSIVRFNEAYVAELKTEIKSVRRQGSRN